MRNHCHALGLLVVVAAAVTACGSSTAESPGDSTAATKGGLVGNPAPDFTAPAVVNELLAR
jgi:hypothetical protein